MLFELHGIQIDVGNIPLSMKRESRCSPRRTAPACPALIQNLRLQSAPSSCSAPDGPAGRSRCPQRLPSGLIFLQRLDLLIIPGRAASLSPAAPSFFFQRGNRRIRPLPPPACRFPAGLLDCGEVLLVDKAFPLAVHHPPWLWGRSNASFAFCSSSSLFVSSFSPEGPRFLSTARCAGVGSGSSPCSFRLLDSCPAPNHRRMGLRVLVLYRLHNAW